jgi:hypothetical protein
MKFQEYINEYMSPTPKKDDYTVGWDHHFKRFGGYKSFLKATDLKDSDVRMYISTGETPEAARKKIRSAVAKHIIKYGAKI